MSRALCIARQKGPEIALLGVFSALVTHNGVVWHIFIHLQPSLSLFRQCE